MGNRSAHLRDRDMYLGAIQTKLEYLVANTHGLMKSGLKNGTFQIYLQELEKSSRKALHHAEVAFRYSKQIDRDEKYPELQEIFLIEDDVDAAELEANRGVIVIDIPDPIPGSD